MAKSLMRQTVTIYKDSTQSTNAYGETSWSGGTTSKAKFELTDEMVIDESGEEVQADAVCYLPNDTTGLAVGNRVDYDSVNYRVLSVKETRDSVGNIHHTKLLLLQWNV